MTYDEFVEELKQFCLDRGFEIAGTCNSEGIYGEITVIEIGGRLPEWENWEKNKFNFTPG